MKHIQLITVFGAALVFLSSCASSYKNIVPERLSYGANNSNSDVSFDYQANVLSTSGNKKLAKKESNSDTKVVAVRIINNSDETVIFGQDLMIKTNIAPVRVLTPEQVSTKIKQNSAAYLLYLLLTPMTLQVGNNETGEIDTYNIGYGVGPGLALLNMGVAAGANSGFKSELERYSLMNREIAPGETVYGLVGLENYSYGNLQLLEMR